MVQNEEQKALAQSGADKLGVTIPSQVMEGSVPALNIPEGQVPVAAASGIVNTSQEILNEEQRRTSEKVAQEANVISASELAIREKMGILGGKAGTQRELNEEMGVNQSRQDISGIINQLRTQTANLSDSDDIFEDYLEVDRQAQGARGGTKQNFANFSAEQRIQRAIDRRSQMAEIRTTQASYYIAEGRYEEAKRMVDEAMDMIYQPVEQELQMELFFLERNDKRMDAAQADMRNARNTAINWHLGEIQEAKNLVDTAVAQGYARAGEIQELLALSGSPYEQSAMARTIINRGAAEERGLRMDQIALSMQLDRAKLTQMSQPDGNAALIQSLFTGEGGPRAISFEEFLTDRGFGNMSPTPEVMEELEAEYNALAPDPQYQQQLLSYLVATGAVSPAQAGYMQTNMDMMTPDKKAKQQTTILRGQTVLRDVNRSLEHVDKAGRFSGWLAERKSVVHGSPTLGARSSPAFELQQHLESIKSNVSIDQLQAMREASPTGGALGQVPVQQQVFLMQVLGSLSPSLDSDVLRENLHDVYNIYLDTMFGTPQELSQAVVNGKMTSAQANSYLQQRKESGFNDYHLPVNKSMGEDIGDLVIAPNGQLVRVKR